MTEGHFYNAATPEMSLYICGFVCTKHLMDMHRVCQPYKDMNGVKFRGFEDISFVESTSQMLSLIRENPYI